MGSLVDGLVVSSSCIFASLPGLMIQLDGLEPPTADLLGNMEAETPILGHDWSVSHFWHSMITRD